MAAPGDIFIVVDLLNPQGRNPKNRPCVIVSLPEQIAACGTLDVVAITTLMPDPLPDDHVRLPWQSPGQSRCKTGLDKPNAAVCSWLVEVESSRVVRKIGRVPFGEMLRIRDALERLRRDVEG